MSSRITKVCDCCGVSKIVGYDGATPERWCHMSIYSSETEKYKGFSGSYDFCSFKCMKNSINKHN